MEFGRVITAMVTPFDDQFEIDWQQLEKLIDYLIDDQQSDGLVVNGTTGESPTLSEEEKLQLFSKTVQYVDGRCKVIAGTGSNNTKDTIELTKKTEALGVDGILLVSPYYNRPSQEGLYQHFKTVAEAISLPVMIYNVPKRTGVHISAETTIRLSQVPNICATKEASGDLDEITKILAEVDEDFYVYSGDDCFTLPILALGGYGVVSVASHIVGSEIQHMISAFLQLDIQKAAKLHQQLNPIFTGLFTFPSPAPVKHALSLKGMPVGSVRLPLLPLNKEEQVIVEKLL